MTATAEGKLIYFNGVAKTRVRVRPRVRLRVRVRERLMVRRRQITMK